MLVNVLLVVGDDRLGDGLADGVDLRGVTTTGDADADVDTGELVGTDDQEGLVDLVIRALEITISNALPLCPWLLQRRGRCSGVRKAYLEAEDLRLDQVEGLAVDLDEALALL